MPESQTVLKMAWNAETVNILIPKEDRPWDAGEHQWIIPKKQTSELESMQLWRVYGGGPGEKDGMPILRLKIPKTDSFNILFQETSSGLSNDLRLVINELQN